MKFALLSLFIGSQINHAFVPRQINSPRVIQGLNTGMLYSCHSADCYSQNEGNESSKKLQLEHETRFTNKIKQSLSKSHISPLNVNYSNSRLLINSSAENAAEATAQLFVEASSIIDPECLENFTDLSSSMAGVSGQSFLMKRLSDGEILFFYVASDTSIEPVLTIQIRIIQCNDVIGLTTDLSERISQLYLQRIDIVAKLIDGDIGSEEYDRQIQAISQEIEVLEMLIRSA